MAPKLNLQIDFIYKAKFNNPVSEITLLDRKTT
jgi:hypothetical protein